MNIKTAMKAALLACLVMCWGCGGAPNDNSGKTEGPFTFTAAIEASAPKTGQNTLMIELKGEDGKPLEGATLKVKPHMPAHGHGSTEEPKIESLGSGKYKAFPVTFQMPGSWEIIVEASANDKSGKHTFTVDVR